MTFQLNIFTPDQLVYEGQVTEVTLPAVGGSMTVLADHMPLTAHLDVGVVRVQVPGERYSTRFAVNGGTMSFRDNVLSISTIEATAIDRREKNAAIFPAALIAKNSNIEIEIQAALQAGGYYQPDQIATNLLAEERLAKFELLRELLNEG